MQLNITKEHIKNGERHSSSSCPIALAVKDLGYNLVSVIAMGVTARKFTTKFSVHAGLPFEAKIFIANFDEGLPVKPFTFELELQ